MEKEILLDEGYSCGRMVYETIGIHHGKLQYVKDHLDRFARAMQAMQLQAPYQEQEELIRQMEAYLATNPVEQGALKIMVSERNLLFEHRNSPYLQEHYQKGYQVCLSPVLRNETSITTFHKTGVCLDLVMEKRRAIAQGYQDVLFCNTKGQMTEASSSNLFIYKDGKLMTPPTSCGLLDGVMRKQIVEREDVVTSILYPKDLMEAQEVFLTNSVMGIMSVVGFEGRTYQSREVSEKLREKMME